MKRVAALFPFYTVWTYFAVACSFNQNDAVERMLISFIYWNDESHALSPTNYNDGNSSLKSRVSVWTFRLRIGQ